MLTNIYQYKKFYKPLHTQNKIGIKIYFLEKHSFYYRSSESNNIVELNYSSRIGVRNVAKQAGLYAMDMEGLGPISGTEWSFEVPLGKTPENKQEIVTDQLPGIYQRSKSWRKLTSYLKL